MKGEKMQTRSSGSGVGVKKEKPGTTSVSETKGKSESKDWHGNPDSNAGVTRTPVSGARLPRLWRKGISPEDVKCFLNQYDEHNERMMIPSEDGVERPVAGIRDLIPRTFVQLLQEDYTSETQNQSKDDALRRALHLFACEDD